jgi:protein SCO1/2
MKIKQTVILLVAFVLPIGIFVFLKTLGKNEFEVAPLHQEGSLKVATDCGGSYQTPYAVQLPVLTDLRWSREDSLTLYVFDTPSMDEKAVTNKLAGTYTDQELQVHKITQDSLTHAGAEDTDPLVKDAVSIDQLRECFFILETGKNAVLVDNRQRIRGYYDLSDREEIDRLAVEVKIILKKY